MTLPAKMEDVIPAIEMFGFEKEDKVKEIQLSELEKTVRIEGRRESKIRPKQSWEVINIIMLMLTDAGHESILDPIFAAKKNSWPKITNEDKKELGYSMENCPLTKWEFGKLVARIQMPNVNHDGTNAAIGMAFHDKGIDISFGLNVQICQNMSVLGGQLYHTYKYGDNEATQWELLEHKVEDWAHNLQKHAHNEFEIMKAMQGTTILNESIISTVIGRLYEKAIRQSYFKGDDAPFDTYGMSAFVQEMIRERKEKEELGTVWDLYNWGTSIMKPGIIDLAGINNCSHEYAKFLLEEFSIDTSNILA